MGFYNTSHRVFIGASGRHAIILVTRRGRQRMLVHNWVVTKIAGATFGRLRFITMLGGKIV